MANFKNVTSTVCGAAGGLNDVLNGIDDFGDKLLETIEAGPAKLASEVTGDVLEKANEAEAFLTNLVPKLPTLKDLGLQDEVDALKGLVGNATAYAAKVATIAAAFGELDFEKIMLATCDADNLKIDSKGRLVTVAKNVTIGDTTLLVEAYDFEEAGKTVGAAIVTAGVDSGVYKGLTKVGEAADDVNKTIGKATQVASKFTNVTKTLT